MAKSPEDVIELTDIIEHGPGAASTQDAGGDVDLSFERELEDLFAEPHSGGAPGSASTKAPDLPGLDDLHLPGESSGQGEIGDIDLDGLDALLADADKGGGAADLPELTDDFLASVAPEAPAATAAPEPPAAPVASAPPAPPAGDDGALAARLDELETKISGLGDALAAQFQALLDESLERLKAELPEPAPAEDPAPLLDALRVELSERLDALQAAQPEPLPQPEPLDEEALAQRLKADILAGLPAPQEPLDEAALEERLRQAVLDSLPPAPEAQPTDVQPLDEEALAQRLKADILAGLPAPQEPLDEAALEERLRQAVLDSLPPAAEAPPSDVQPLDEEALAQRLKADILAGLPAPQAADPVDIAPLNAALQSQEERLAALESAPAPDVSAFVTKDDLAALRQELLAEIRKAVPAAAAQIIREEIQALVREMD